MGTLTGLFWNREEARLRAGWRVAIFWLGSFVLGFALLRLRDAVLARRLIEVYRNPVEAALYLLLVGVPLLWLLGSRLLDRRPLGDYGFHLCRAWWADLGVGLALGALLMLGMFALELALGWVTVTGTLATADPGPPFALALLAGFVAFVCVAVQEEVVWRGYPMKNLAEGLNGRAVGPRWAIIVAALLSSVVFGLAHADNLDATVFSTINTMVFALLLLSAGYALTGELALPLGLHFAWNFVQVYVLGYYGGAARFGASVLAVAEGDPAGRRWTGLPYGHEGGLLGTGACLVGFVLIAAWVRRRRGGVAVHPSLAQPPPGLAAASGAD